VWILEATCTANKKGRYGKGAIRSGCGITPCRIGKKYKCTDCGAVFTLGKFGRIKKQYPIQDKPPLPGLLPFEPKRAYLLSAKRDS
jgi:hypothetical protein